MSKKVAVLPTQAVQPGTEFYAYSSNLKVGDEVDICRSIGVYVGKPIARGRVVASGSQDARASVGHSANGNSRAWANYWKVRVIT